MSKFNKGKKRKVPAASTAALPDIVFMLLFFFMVTTVFKEKESKKVKVDKVSVKETENLQKNILAAYYWIGKVPGKLDPDGNPEYMVQLDDDLISPYSDDITIYLNELKKDVKYKGDKWEKEFYNLFKIDKEAEMHNILEVQRQLKAAEAYKVLYSVKKK